MAGVLTDTSFLITLVDPSRPNHQTAKDYYRYALENGIELRLSSLVVSEFCVKQPLEDLRTQNFVPLNFDIIDGSRAGSLSALIQRAPSDRRLQSKVDVMLIAQAERHRLPIITDDGTTLAHYCDRFRQDYGCDVHSILLGEGFDPGRLINPNIPSLPLMVSRGAKQG